LETLIAETIESVYDSSERNRLRMERARLLLDRGGKRADAVSALREILEEEPEAFDAARVLADMYEQADETDALLELLERQFESGRDRNDGPNAASMALRLGALLEPTRRDDALAIYRAAAAVATDNHDLLRTLVRMYMPDDDPNERASAMERLLALES